MKMRTLLIALVTVCLLCTAAVAAPAVTDGVITGWIADNNYLFLMNESGKILQLPMEICDLLTMNDQELMCLTKDQKVIAVKRDGSGSRNVENVDIGTLVDARIRLEEDGKLFLNGKQVSSTACAAVTDGIYLYSVEKVAESYVLRVSAVDESGRLITPGSRSAFATGMANKIVSEPLSMTVTEQALTLTGKDHKVTVMNLTNGDVAEYPATSVKTASACLMNGMIYRYEQTENLHWELQSALVVNTPEPTPAPTPTPTPTPAPTATPKPTPDEDGTIYRGDSGDAVRKIQKRLSELGYPVGRVDGVYGAQTQLAINLFCNAIHVREHNYIPVSVQKKLLAKNAPYYDPYLPLQKGDQGVSVLYMQEQLKKMGYDPGKLDGIYGEDTVAAVAEFQVDYKIKRAYKEVPGEYASHEMLEILFSKKTTPVPEYEDLPDGESHETR